MKAYHLTESAEPQDVAIIFGRFNPPHFGHVHAWMVAAELPHWYVGTNQDTAGPKEPLPFDIKIEAMKTLYPEIEGHLVGEQSWLALAVMVYKKYGPNITLHIVTDENDKNIHLPYLQKQNAMEGPHGYYRFKDVVWAKAERKTEAKLVRQAVAENNPKNFAKYAGVPADTVVAGHPYFQLVRHYMLPYMQAEEEKKRQKAEREAAKAEKERLKAEKQAAKAKGPAQELAERSVSQKQARFMAAAAHDPAFAKKVGIKQSVAKEFNKADTGTKQLSNAMKNKPKKRLSEELEIVYENRHGSIQSDVADALPATYVIPKLQNQDAYNQYRFGLAVAAARGEKARKTEHGERFEGVSPWGENDIVVTFDPNEAETSDAALKLVGLSPSDKKSLNSKESLESKDVSKFSPVAKIKKNKYGV